MIVTFFHFLFGWFGLGLVVCVISGALWWFAESIPFIPTSFRQILLYICIVSGTGTTIYTAGYSHGRNDLKSEIQRKVERDVAQAGAARDSALDDLKSGRVPADWFRD